jgi:hypothetical protein
MIFELSERFNKEQQVEMKKWEPNPKKIYLATYDFEWVLDGER